MARVTVEDCLKNVKNRFELVVIAAKRARQLMRGKEPKVDWDNDKATVVALREIAEGYTNFDAPEIKEEEQVVETAAITKPETKLEETKLEETEETKPEALDASQDTTDEV